MPRPYKLILILLSFWSCKNEIKIAAPWKETVIVYGMLDPAAPDNYLRIQKAFLDPEGNAFQFVQTSDSIYPTDLDVKLYMRLNGSITDSIFPVLINGKSEGIAKDSGLFSNTPNYLYKITKPIKDSRLSPGAEDYEYELFVTDKKTGYRCTAKTYAVGLLEPQAPVINNATPITIRDKANSYMTVAYREGRKVKAYDMKIKFWYKETRMSNPLDTVIKSLDWTLFKNRLTDPSLRGYEQKISSFPGSILYDIIQANIKVDKDIKRTPLYFDLEFYGAGEDLYTYIEVNVPSIGIVQKKPEFTNIENGLGIFSSRYITKIKQVPVSAEMKTILKNSVYTIGLNF